MSTTAEKIKVLQKRIMVMEAHEEGEEIEMMLRFHEDATWQKLTHQYTPEWDWEAREYRVKPEPLTLWVNFHESGHHGATWTSKQDAMEAARENSRTVKMQEVPE